MNALATRLTRLVPFRVSGQVSRVAGLTIEASGLPAQVGEICHIYAAEDGHRISAEVVGFHGERVFLMPFGEPDWSPRAFYPQRSPASSHQQRS